MSEEYIAESLKKPCASRCLRCGWHSAEGATATAAIASFRGHDCVADRVAVTA